MFDTDSWRGKMCAAYSYCFGAAVLSITVFEAVATTQWYLPKEEYNRVYGEFFCCNI